jgi:hypothetical protein
MVELKNNGIYDMLTGITFQYVPKLQNQWHFLEMEIFYRGMTINKEKHWQILQVNKWNKNR